tara:strand:+ start:1293 stop:1970 length:678 start_codon:yes stop_codon:yes gene_type:complete
VSFLEKDWRRKRRAKKKEEVKKDIGIDVDEWVSTIADETRKSDAQETVNAILTADGINPSTSLAILTGVHKGTPNHPQYHFRDLHEDIKDEVRPYYEDKNYYSAISEALKVYLNNSVNKARKKEPNLDTDQTAHIIFAKIFGDTGILSLTDGYLRPGGDDFYPKTKKSIENGQRSLSQGVFQGFRNPESHEVYTHLKRSDLLGDQDCLDALSILSYLLRRLDKAK